MDVWEIYKVGRTLFRFGENYFFVGVSMHQKDHGKHVYVKNVQCN